MPQVLLYLLTLIIAAIGMAWLAEAPGTATIMWKDYRIDMSAAFLLFAVVTLGILISLLWQGWRWLVYAPRRLRRHRRQLRQMRGLRAVTLSLAAITAGEAARARPQIARAHKYLGNAPILPLLQAQLARLEQDEPQIRLALEDMLTHRETRGLAARGLAEESARRGDLTQAERFAHQATAAEPGNPQGCETLFRVHLQTKSWQQAEHLIGTARRKRLLTADTAKRWRALVRLARAESLLQDGEQEMALLTLSLARKLAPASVPVALPYIRLSCQLHQPKQAASALLTAWKRTPHPLLADALRPLARELPPKAAQQLARKMEAAHPGHAESALAIAYVEMEAKHWQAARDTLRKAAQSGKNARILRTLAEIERDGFGDAEAAANDLLQSAQAPGEARWRCHSCHFEPERWHVFCPACTALDSLEWKEPSAPSQAAI